MSEGGYAVPGMDGPVTFGRAQILMREGREVSSRAQMLRAGEIESKPPARIDVPSDKSLRVAKKPWPSTDVYLLSGTKDEHGSYLYEYARTFEGEEPK